MNRRGFLKGVFGAAALAALPKLRPQSQTTFIPEKAPAPPSSDDPLTAAMKRLYPRERIQEISLRPKWTMLIYGTPILFVPKKTLVSIHLLAERQRQSV